MKTCVLVEKTIAQMSFHHAVCSSMRCFHHHFQSNLSRIPWKLHPNIQKSRAPHIHISRTCSLSRYLPMVFSPTVFSTHGPPKLNGSDYQGSPLDPKVGPGGQVHPKVSAGRTVIFMQRKKRDGKTCGSNRHRLLLMILMSNGFWWKKQKTTLFFFYVFILWFHHFHRDEKDFQRWVVKVSDLAISDPDPSGNCRGSKYPDWRPADPSCVSQSFGTHCWWQPEIR